MMDTDLLEAQIRQARWAELIDGLQHQAAAWIAGGQAAELSRLLDQADKNAGHNQPWLAYWQGRCLLALDLPAAPAQFAQAIEDFERIVDLDGITRSCAGLLDALWLLQEDCHDFDPWLDYLEQLRERLQSAGRDDLLRALSRSALAGLYVRRPDHPDLPYWEDLSLNQLGRDEPIDEAMLRGLQLMLHYTWNTGQRGRATLVLETLQSRLGKQRQPGYVLCLYHVVHAAYLLWFSEHIDDCREVVEQGLELSDSLQLPDWDLPLLNSLLYASCAHERLELAEQCAERIKERIRLQPRPMDRAIQHHFLAYRAWLQGHPQDALPAIDSAVAITRDCAYAYPRLLCELAQAVLLAETGREQTALKRLQELANTARRYRSDNSLYTALMNRAIVLQQLDRQADCLQVLEQAMAIGARHRYCSIPWVRHDDLARLCLLALEAGIQPEFAADLVHRLDLPAPAGTGHDQTRWPWPCRIHLLGRVRIEQPGQQDNTDNRSAGSLHRLLLGLVTAGPEGIDIDALADRLWPDCDGDTARGRLKVSVHRLRRLLGNPSLIHQAHRRIWLDPARVWVDAWAFEHSEDPERSLSLYHGHLIVPNEEDPLPWHYARRLADLHAQRVTRHAGRLESVQHWQQALSVWRRALTIDPAPAFFEGAIRCLRQLGRPDQASELEQEYRRWQQPSR